MNELNIGDTIRFIMPGYANDGCIGVVEQMAKFPPDGKILYIAAYHQECPGGEGYNTSAQFGEGQYELIKRYKKPKSKCKGGVCKI